MIMRWLLGDKQLAAYWFTSSTSFANLAITVARNITNRFAGIRPHDVPSIVIAQPAGAAPLQSWRSGWPTNRGPREARQHPARYAPPSSAWTPRCFSRATIECARSS